MIVTKRDFIRLWVVFATSDYNFDLRMDDIFILDLWHVEEEEGAEVGAETQRESIR